MSAHGSSTAAAFPISGRLSSTRPNRDWYWTMIGWDAVDLFFSVAVFQHFPSKAYTKEVLGATAGLMRTGAHGLVQVRYFDGSEKLRQKEEDYAKNVIYMTSFTTEEFSALLAETGLTLLGSMRDLDGPKDRHEYCFFRK